MIDKCSRIPLYVQVYEALRRKIVSREWRPGQAIPPERELVAIFKVSRITIRSAVDELVREGLLVREKGKGTFAAPQRHSYRFTTLTSFTEELINNGLTPGTRILDFSRTPADDGVAGRLCIPAGDEIIRLERLRYADGIPVAINLSRLPSLLCPGLKAEDIADNSLYRILEKRYGLYIKKASREFETVEADAREAGLLEIAPGTQILKLVGTVSTADGVVVDYCEEYYK